MYFLNHVQSYVSLKLQNWMRVQDPFSQTQSHFISTKMAIFKNYRYLMHLVVCDTAHFEYHVSPQLSCSIRYCITILLIVIREMVCVIICIFVL